MIYFVQAVDGGPIKIGHSADVPGRVRQLEAHYGKPLAVLATMDGDRAVEAELHARFAHLRFGRTEQFRPDPGLMTFIGRPLFVNQGDVELMPVDRVVIAHIKGTPEYAAFLDAVNLKSHIPKAAIFRLAVAEWCERNGYGTPPEL